MATWVISLDASFSEAVDLVVQHKARFNQHSNVLDKILESTLLLTDPVHVALLLAHLLKSTEAPFYDGRYLARVVKAVRSGGGSDLVGVIIEQAVRLGWPGSETS